MPDFTAEEFVQRSFDLGLIDARQIESIWSELGSREVPTKEIISLVLRKELMTNWQIERIMEGKRDGYIYGKYKILYLVGSGTFARVYRAVKLDSDKVVALKVLRQRYSDDMSRTDQFLMEAKTVMELRHPNIVAIHDVRSERGRHYMVMDFIEGQNLRDWVRRCVKLLPKDALSVISDVVGGLDFAAKKGVYHRDMKLSNVLVSSRGRASIVDFGLAATEQRVTEENVGDIVNPRSIDYAGLERASGGGKEDKRSDLFFVGAMLYHLLCGNPALYETKDRISRLNPARYSQIKPIAEVEPTLPARLVMCVNKSLDVKANDRFQTPSELLAELGEIKGLLNSNQQVANARSKANTSATEKVEPPVRLEGDSRTIMLVESAAALQDVMRKRLKDLGYKVLVISDPQRALARFDFEPAADCVIFGTGELGVKALNAFNHFATSDMTSEIPAVLLVDKRQRNQVLKQAKLSDCRVLASMPLRFKEFRASLKQLIDQAHANA